MEQYFALKAKYKDAILLFRVGDFYETFGEDAIKTSKALGIVLTNRNNGTSKNRTGRLSPSRPRHLPAPTH